MSKPNDLPDGIYFGLDETTYHALPRLSASGIKTMMTSIEDFWDESWMNPLRVRQETTAMTLGTAYHKRILEGSSAFYATHIAANEGKVMLPPWQVQQIEYAAAFIEKHPVLGKAFTGGQPEVTILWTDAEFNVPMKARLDYLKVKGLIDLKTFSNPMGKVIDDAVYGSIASGRYHVQAAVYLDAIEYARSLYAEDAVHGDHDPEWLGKCMRTKEHAFMFVFQKSVGAPLVRAMGRKAEDRWTIPLAPKIHAAAHASGCPETWLMENYGIDARARLGRRNPHRRGRTLATAPGRGRLKQHRPHRLGCTTGVVCGEPRRPTARREGADTAGQKRRILRPGERRGRTRPCHTLATIFWQNLKRNPSATTRAKSAGVRGMRLVKLADKAHTATDVQRLRDAWKALGPSFAHLRPDQLDRAACRMYVRKRREAGRADGSP